MIRNVLYVHGLESGPNGRKARHLATAGFNVVAKQMPCGRAQILRDPVVMLLIGSAVALLGVCTVLGGWIGLASCAAIEVASVPFVRPCVFRRIWRLSVEVQSQALKENAIDLVVGSSFGGAVALELLRNGAWSGPTLLLCPAHNRLAERAGLPVPKPPMPAAVASRVVVVHGRKDDIVPLSDSQALVEGTSARLLVVDDDHRLSATADPARFAEWIALLDQPNELKSL
jgi:hypothetical protein